MQTVILPGHNSKNKEWADLVAQNLNVEGQIRPIFWDHWLDSSQLFYPEEKAMLISRHAKGDKLNIIAHSVGTLVCAYIIDSSPEFINKVVVCGIPLNDISLNEKELIRKTLSSLNPNQLVCYQNKSDPHGDYEELRRFLPETIKVVCSDRTDHNYPLFNEFNEFLNS